VGLRHQSHCIAASRDVIYLQIELKLDEPRAVTLAGVTFDGQVLWRSTLDVQDAISEVVAFPGRVYVLACDGTLLCLEESG